jgi:hypothetical protein
VEHWAPRSLPTCIDRDGREEELLPLAVAAIGAARQAEVVSNLHIEQDRDTGHAGAVGRKDLEPQALMDWQRTRRDQLCGGRR